MNRVIRRAWIMGVFILILVLGITLFLVEFVAKAEDWVTFTGSPHLYNSSDNIGTGYVTDREGLLLLDIRQSRTYSTDLTIRKSTLHWLGDRKGYISAPAVAYYAKEMTGYDLLNGVYNYGNSAGNATLTLSARVQSVALEAMGDRKGTIAVYNYKTGEILCALTTPIFDPDDAPDVLGDTTGAYEGIYLNRFTQSTYIPGSIFKIVTTAVALDSVEGIMDMQFTCNGILEYGIDKVSCERAHGKQTIKQAFANSCNCAYAQIAQLLGKDTMTEYVERFGVTKSICFDGITTVEGNYDVSTAAPVQLAWSCIGQYTDQVNPCAYLTFLGAIGGGGVGAQPYIVKSVAVGEQTTYEAKTQKGERILSAKTVETLQSFMRNNVESVYGASKFPDLTVCAKSGTSQLGGGQTSNAMFAGFVADEAYPLAFICVVENGGYGASTCVPVISKVLVECKRVMDGAQ